MRKAHAARVDAAVAGRGKDFDLPPMAEAAARRSVKNSPPRQPQLRNTPAARIKWMFITEKASAKWGGPIQNPEARSASNQRIKTSVPR
jgi:hypothetical protein